MVDFIVDIPAGRRPVVLQLSDPQMLDASQALPGRLGEGEGEYWAKDKAEERCFGYIREIVENTSPDLILIAGDVVYGEFDHDGSALRSFVDFMESLGLPWAPVLGNHETESRMGVDRQCAHFTEARHCLFKQRTLTGNGNYTVGIRQGGRLLRVFYMMDSNSGRPSEASVANGHSVHPTGFGEDQIAWYTESITALRRQSPDTRVGFMFHIPIAAFARAYEKYGYTDDKASGVFPIQIEGDTDFGIILTPFKVWDKDDRVWNGMKTLGVDLICAGHEHEICASAVYEGVRLQFGLKSSTYDSNIYKDEGGRLVMSWIPAGIPVIGGTVMELSSLDGGIERAYHYYCKSVTFEK